MALTRQRACTFKRPFEQQQAEEVLKAIKKAGRQPGFSTMNAYKCPFCPFWHLGHSRRRHG